MEPEEEEFEEESMEEEEEESEEEFDVESEVINSPYLARIPTNRLGYQWPTPHWAKDLERWSCRQHQCSPFGTHQGYYNVNHRGPADRALPITIKRIKDLGDQTRATVNWVLELGAATEVTDAHTQDLDRYYYPMDRLLEDLTTARAEVREYLEMHSTLEERVVAAERQLAKIQGASTSS